MLRWLQYIRPFCNFQKNMLLSLYIGWVFNPCHLVSPPDSMLFLIFVCRTVNWWPHIKFVNGFWSQGLSWSTRWIEFIFSKQQKQSGSKAKIKVYVKNWESYWTNMSAIRKLVQMKAFPSASQTLGIETQPLCNDENKYKDEIDLHNFLIVE